MSSSDQLLNQYLQQQQPLLDGEALSLLIQAVSLRSTESKGYPLTILRADGSGAVRGFSLRPFQLMRIDQRAFRKKLLSIGAQAVLLTTVDGWLPIVAAILMLAMDFEELHYREYTTEQAQLLMLLHVGNGTPTIKELVETYHKRFGITVTPDFMRSRLEELSKLKLLEFVGENGVRLRETVIYRRA